MQNQLFILVPGIAGSKIYCDCSDNSSIVHKRLYPKKNWFFNSVIDDHMYDCSKVSTKPLRSFWNFSIYGKFIDKIEKCPLHRVNIFSYDWRRNPVDLARDLLIFIRQCSPHDFTHLKLIGHSLGGLVIRIAIEYLNGLNEMYIAPHQVTVYQCGTPMYGSQNIYDYNYGFELAAVLASSGIFTTTCPSYQIKRRDIKKIKPFLFTVENLKKIIATSSDNLLYLLPSPIIFTIYTMMQKGQLSMKDNRNFELVYNVHVKLANLQFPVKYIHFYNISCQKIEKIYVPFKTQDFFNKITVHDIKPGSKTKSKCGIHLNRLLKSDGLVVPYSDQKIPYNCNIYVDESENCKHAFLMNSTELIRLVLNSHTFEYINEMEQPLDIHSDNTSLPGYNDIV